MNRIDSKFRELKKNNEKAVIIYLTCGYPDLSITERLVLELDRQGVDLIELGVPFSDPLADGPTIQEASSYALRKHSVNLRGIFSLVSRLRRKTQIPICLMTYYNPIFSFGESNFVSCASKSGVDGVIIPDLPPEEAKNLTFLSKKYNLHTIFLLSPTSSRGRIKLISSASRGFIYYVSLTGVTGIRQHLAFDLCDNIRKIKKYTKKPVCAGFGISGACHIREIFKVADGAIIGSAVIKLIRDNIGKKGLVEKVGKFVESLMKAKD